MNKFELNQHVRVQWPDWQKGAVGTITDIFPANYETFYVVDVGESERYTYKEHELEAVNEGD